MRRIQFITFISSCRAGGESFVPRSLDVSLSNIFRQTVAVYSFFDHEQQQEVTTYYRRHISESKIQLIAKNPIVIMQSLTV